MKKILKIGYQLILAVIFVFLLAVAGTFLPVAGNYKIFTVQSGSMAPKIGMGSLIFVKSATDYNIGDVVTLKARKNSVTHRIVGKNTENGEIIYKTKGDANEEADAEETNASNVIGKAFFTLPYVGYPIGYARTKTGFILLVIIPSTIIVYEELYKIKDEIAKKYRSRREQKEKISAPENIEDRIRIIEEEPKAVSGHLVQNSMKPASHPRRKII